MDNLTGIEYICNLVVKRWIRKNIITEEFEEWYTFGLFSFVSGLINLAIYIILGIILGLFKETLVFILVFVLTREFMGGYHCDTPLRCKFVSVMVYFIIMYLYYVSFFGDLWLVTIISLFIIGNAVINIFCPVQNHNKILEESLQKKYKVISFFVYNIFIVFDLVLYFINNKYADIITATLMIVVIMAVIGYYKERRIYNVK